jgi:hypothetical protein
VKITDCNESDAYPTKHCSHVTKVGAETVEYLGVSEFKNKLPLKLVSIHCVNTPYYMSNCISYEKPITLILN